MVLALRKVLLSAFLLSIMCAFHPAFSQEPLSSTWVTNGSVRNITTGGGKAFIFSYSDWLGESYQTDHFVLNSDFSHDDSWPKGPGNSYSAVGDGNGGYYAVQYDTIYHYKSDKTIEGLPVQCSGITQIARIGNILYLAGYFGTVNGVARNSMAAVDASNGFSVTPFAPEPNSSVNVMYAQDGVLYVGGYFSSIGGQSRSKLAALDPITGLATSWNPKVSTEYGAVSTIAGNKDNIYFAGTFNNVNGATPARKNMGAVAINNASVLAFNPSPDNYIQALLVENDVVYACGYFNNIGGTERHSVAALDATTGKALSLKVDFGPDQTYLNDIAIDGDHLLITGDLSTVNGVIVGDLVAVDKTTGATVTTKPRNVKGSIYSMIPDNGKIFFFGGITGITGINNNTGYFGLDKSGVGFNWNAKAPALNTNLYVQNSLLNYYNGKVYFYQQLSDDTYSFGALSPTTGELISSFSVTVNGNIDAWTFGNNAIYFAGDFDQVNKDNRYGMAAINSETGETLPWETELQPNSDQRINSMTFYDNQVFVAGSFYFSNQNGDSRSDLMAFDAKTGVFTEWDPSVPDQDDYSITRIGPAENNQIYIMGTLVFRVDTQTGKADGWKAKFDGDYTDIFQLVIGPNVVYAGGNYNPGVLAFDKKTADQAEVQPAIGDVNDDEGGLLALAIGNGKLYVGGDFSFATAIDERQDYAEFLLDDSGNRPPVIQTTKISVIPDKIIRVPLPALLSDPDGNLDLTSLKVLQQPISGAKASIDSAYNLILDYSAVSFSGTEYLTIEVCDLLSACTEQELQLETGADIIVYNGVSPNNDDMNDILLIENIDVYPKNKNKVSIIDRWGDVVFEVFDYNNDDHSFRGKSKSGNDLPAGTYYYKIVFADGSKTRVGHLALRR